MALQIWRTRRRTRFRRRRRPFSVGHRRVRVMERTQKVLEVKALAVAPAHAERPPKAVGVRHLVQRVIRERDGAQLRRRSEVAQDLDEALKGKGVEGRRHLLVHEEIPGKCPDRGDHSQSCNASHEGDGLG